MPPLDQCTKGMMGCINDLYILFYFYFCSTLQLELMDRACEYLMLLPPLHVLSFSFWLSGIVLVTGRSSENWVKELRVRPEAVPLLSQFSAPWKSQFLSHSLTHSLMETQENNEGQRDLELKGYWWTQAGFT